MTPKPESPVAFPNFHTAGMSLRDYFAIRAPEMPEWWLNLETSRDAQKARKDDRFIRRSSLELEAAWKYQYADAMLAERMKHAKN